MNLPRREVKITSETDIATARIIGQAETIEERQPYILPKWRRDVIGPAILQGGMSGIFAFFFAILIVDEWQTAIALMVIAAAAMFVAVFWFQMVFFNLAHKIVRKYQIKQPDDTGPVFVQTKDNPTEKQLQRQPPNLNEPLAIMARRWVKDGKYAGPQHMPKREELRKSLKVKMSNDKFKEFYTVLDRQGYIAGENKLVTLALVNELLRRAAATPAPSTVRPELRPA